MSTNAEIILASRPTGAPVAANFEHRAIEMPTIGDGQVHLRLIYLSLDPYLRGRMNAGKSYVPPFEVGAAMGSGCVAEVMESRNDGFAAGDLVMGGIDWVEHQAHSGEGLMKLDGRTKPSYALGVLGMPGMTAWAGLNIHGKPKEGETLVVSAASGAVGSLVTQLGKSYGLRVVGVAGGAEKCGYVVDELGADACVDHRDLDLNAKLAAACPNGADIYFENVGGVTLDAVVPLMNPFSRMPVCGMIANYNDTGAAEGQDRLPFMMRSILTKRIAVRGFIVRDHWEKFPDFLAEVGPKVMSGEIKVKETMTQGLENTPAAFISLLEGGNFGKQVVQVGADPTA